jgi:hypothetical protein
VSELENRNRNSKQTLEKSADHHGLNVRGNGNWYLEDSEEGETREYWSDEGQPTRENGPSAALRTFSCRKVRSLGCS